MLRKDCVPGVTLEPERINAFLRIGTLLNTLPVFIIIPSR